MIESYFDYICSLVGIDQHSRYKKLSRFLMRSPFYYIIPMDDNRYADGVDLRYHFGCDMNIPSPVVSSELDGMDCSVLEMMIALAVRANDIITSDGDPSFIFWSMIDSLGLSSQTDNHFDEDYCHECIERFLNREYLPNGIGGLVTLSNPPTDLRNVEIWCQVMWWLNEL